MTKATRTTTMRCVCVCVCVCVCFLCADRRVDFVIIQSFWGFARGIMEGATCSNVCSHLVGVLPE